MSKAIPETPEKTTEQTSFCPADLAIRNRVLAFKAALDATPVEAPIQDELLASFCREVENLQSQLATVEAQFGRDTPMARVLREALESARCRKATRRIELGLDEEEKKPVQVAQMAPKPQKEQGFGWAWFGALMVLDNQQYQRTLQAKPAWTAH